MNQKNNNKIISFIIPLYGKPNSLMKELIDKITVLNIPETEFIIVYKNSQDFNYDWMHNHSIENKLKIIGPVKNEAQRTFKICRGAQEAKGKWIQIFDAHHDFYADKLKYRIETLRNLEDKYDLIVSTQRIVKRLENGKEKTIWKTRPKKTIGIWNGTTLFKRIIFNNYLKDFMNFNHSIGDDRTYPIILFHKEPNLRIKYLPKDGYYKQMIYQADGINTTTGVGFNTKLAETICSLVDYMIQNTERKSYMNYITFYWLIINSYAFYHYMWKGKRAFWSTRKAILNSKLPRRIKWPLLFVPWYLTSLTNSTRRYKIRRNEKKLEKEIR